MDVERGYGMIEASTPLKGCLLMEYKNMYVGAVESVRIHYSDKSRLTKFCGTTLEYILSPSRRLDVLLNHNKDGRE